MITRLEADSIGEKEIDSEAYYGVQSLRANENFPITGIPMHSELIKALAQLKRASAMTNRDSGRLDGIKSYAIIQACDEIIEGKLYGQFIVDAIQGGAGTSANMNANEVIANHMHKKTSKVQSFGVIRKYLKNELCGAKNRCSVMIRTNSGL